MTVITATPVSNSLSHGPRIQLAITGAPIQPTDAYASNFAAGVDSWSNGGGAAVLTNDTTTAPARLVVTGPTTTAEVTAERNLGGLVIGAQYRLRVFAIRTRGEVKLAVRETGGTVIASSAYLSPTGDGAWLELLFTATATTHVLRLAIKQTVIVKDYATGATSQAKLSFHTITVRPTGTWQGTTIYRTDANGTDVPVRENQGGLDTVGGQLTLTDWEAAQHGLVTYRVLDGNGVSTSVTTSFRITRRNQVTNPSFETNTTTWTASRGTLTRVVSGTSPHGAALGQYTSTDASTPTGNSITGDFLPGIEAGQTYTASVSVKCSGSAVAYRLRILWYTATDVFVEASDFTSGQLSLTEFTRLAVTAPAPATAAKARLVVNAVPALAVGVGFVLDGFMLEAEAELQPYFDGSTPDTADVTYAWAGTAHASESIEVTADSTGPGPVPLATWLLIPTTSTPGLDTFDPPTSAPAELVLRYDETREFNGSLHTIIGRSDKVANPGPLMLRSGVLDVFCVDYSTAIKVRDLLVSGAAIFLSQPDFPGLDMYFVGRSVAVNPEMVDSKVRRWVTSISYDEVPRP